MKYFKIFAIALLMIFLTSCTDEDANYITSAVVNNEGHLILTYEDGTIVDQGLVVPEVEVVEVEYHLVNFYNTEGYIISTQIIEHEEAAFAPTLEVPEHLIFDMWDQDFSSITGDVNIHPIVIENTFTISFHGTETPIPDMTGIAFGETVTLPVQEITGKTFLGWFVSDSPYAPMAPMYGEIHADMNLYARYEDIEYTVTYHTMGGTEIISQEALYGDLMVMPETPSKEDYFFNGWYLDQEEMIPAEFDTMITEDKDIYVSWIQFEYTFNDSPSDPDDEQIIIDRVIGNHNYVYVPSIIDGYEVKIIGHHAFRYENFYAVYLPDTIEHLFTYAFADMPNLTSIVLPDSILYVEEGTFLNCTSLTDVTLPSNLIGVAYRMFENTAIESIVIPEGYDYIGPYAFKDSPLASINIPASLTIISDYSFSNTQITEMVIPEGVTNLGGFAFKDCLTLTTISLPESLVSIGSNPFLGASSLTSVTLHESNPNYELVDDVIFNELIDRLVLYLPYKADTTYQFPETIRYFNYYSMTGNSYVETLLLPDTLEYFYPQNNFTDMDSLSAFQVYDAPGTANIASESGVLYSADFSTLFKYPMGRTNTAYTLHASTTVLYTKSFEENIYINSVILNDGIQRLYDYAFENCINLSAINFPSSLQYIYTGAFYNVDGITTINLPSTIISIGGYAFAEMDNLSTLILSDNLNFLPYRIIENSNNVTTLNIPASVTNISTDLLVGSNGLTTVTVDVGNSAFNSYNNSIYSEDYTILLCVPGGLDQESYYTRSETIYLSANFGTNPYIKIIRVNSNVLYFQSNVQYLPNLQGIVFYNSTTVVTLNSWPFNPNTDEEVRLYVREALYDDYLTNNYWALFIEYIIAF